MQLRTTCEKHRSIPQSFPVRCVHTVAMHRPALLAKVRRLNFRTHVPDQTGLHLPSTILQNPNVIAGVVDSESFRDVAQGRLVPMGVCDTATTSEH